MKLAPNYECRMLTEVTPGQSKGMCTITLFHTTDPQRKKVFEVFGDSKRLFEHMNSLTDTLCDEFTKLPGERKNPKAKKAAGSK